MPAPNAEISRRLELLRDHFRHGRHDLTENMLLWLQRGRLSAEQRLECANLARRAAFPELAARFLHPAVKRGRASDGELAEYAAALSILGSSAEAERFFSRVDASRAPESLYLRAVGRMAEWRFDDAVPLLERYLETPLESERRGQTLLRLGMCLMRSRGSASSKPDERRAALSRARELQREGEKTVPETSRPLALYAHHLKAELRLLLDDDAAAAIAELEALEKRFEGADVEVPRLLRVLLQLKARGESAALRQTIARDREKVRREGNWHVLRTYEVYEAIHLSSRACLERAFFGNAMPGLRRYLLDRCPWMGALPDSHVWALGDERASGQAWTLDLVDGTHSGGRGLLKAGQLGHALLLALASDFHRPLPEAELHERLYPGDPYDPDRSSRRVRILVHRLRRWLEAEKAPLAVEAGTRTYRLVATSAQAKVCVRVPNPENAAQGHSGPPAVLLRALEELARRLGPEGSASFTAARAAKAWAVSPRSAQYRLKEALAFSLAASSGRGPATRYRLIGAN